jgi:hypothetical protein
MIEAFVAVLGAVLTSAVTCCFAYYFYRTRLSVQLDKLRDELGAEVEERVRKGVLAAGEELLPEFRKEVAAGFRDALKSVGGADMARSMARTGADLVGGSLDTLFGTKKRSPHK